MKLMQIIKSEKYITGFIIFTILSIFLNLSTLFKIFVHNTADTKNNIKLLLI